MSLHFASYSQKAVNSLGKREMVGASPTGGSIYAVEPAFRNPSYGICGRGSTGVCDHRARDIGCKSRASASPMLV